MLSEERHLTSAGKVLRFLNSSHLYPVNQYQSLLLATASELAITMLVARHGGTLAELAAWEPCCGGGPAAVTLKHLGVGHVQATDLSPDAVESCVTNASANDVHLDRTTAADLLADGENRLYDLICCNPPCGPDVASDAAGAAMDLAVRGGETGVEVTCRLVADAKSRLTPIGSLLFVAVSTTHVTRLIDVLDRHFPGRWRTFPSTPVAAPYRRVDDARAQWLTDPSTAFQPMVWRRDDGWYWRLSWVIEASNDPELSYHTGFALRPYGLQVDQDPELMAMINSHSPDGHLLNSAQREATPPGEAEDPGKTNRAGDVTNGERPIT